MDKAEYTRRSDELGSLVAGLQNKTRSLLAQATELAEGRRQPLEDCPSVQSAIAMDVGGIADYIEQCGTAYDNLMDALGMERRFERK